MHCQNHEVFPVPTSKSTIQALVTFRNSQGEVARGTLLKIDRSTVVFEVYNPYSIVQLSEVLQQLTIRRGERKVYEGRAVVNNLVNTGLMLIVSVNLVDPWSDLAEVSGSKTHLRQEAERFVSDWSASNRIRPGYQLVVGEIQSLFSGLSRWLEQLDIAEDEPRYEHRSRLSDDLFFELSEPITREAKRLLLAFEEEAATVPTEEIVQHRAYVQKCVHPLILRAPFPYRAFSKPLGYAGDYEMVNMMLSDPRKGPSTYAELINTIYLTTGPAEAHKNRIRMLVDLLSEVAAVSRSKEKPLRVLNVGCGPAVELQRFLASGEVDERMYINLVDFNRETLNYTKKRLGEVLAKAKVKPEIAYTHMSVHALLKSAAQLDHSEQEQPYDLIYCAGLFDYLSDRVSSRLVRLFCQLANPKGGVVVVTNVHPDNSALFLMEHILEWFLIYRDENTMSSLAKGMSPIRVYTDETGINVFLRIERTG